MIDRKNSDPALPIGYYERVIDNSISRAIELLGPDLRAKSRPIDAAEIHAVLGQYIGRAVAQSLLLARGSDSAYSDQRDLCNTILKLLDDVPMLPNMHLPEYLLSVTSESSSRSSVRPSTPLSQSCLLTGTRQDPSMLSQLRAELATADGVDILCSFVKWSGLRTLEQEFRELTGESYRSLRVVTTTYLGATDKKAIDFLTGLRGAQVRVSYDTARTRLHAKAYLFHRQSGFGTAYIGSSNLSDAAMTDGLEWNVKISQYESPQIWNKITATFDSYWNDDRDFVSYAGSAEDQQRLEAALSSERRAFGAESYSDSGEYATLFDLHPYPFQQEILDKLEADRSLRKQFRNLVIAATGTGKTIISAFDYRRFARDGTSQQSERPTLLFTAHREEILKQSLYTFRAVLRDPNFGDLMVGSAKEPSQQNHLFVSIQTYNSRSFSERFAKEFFDYVVIDEFHHAEAPSYRRLLDHIRPRILLGLTATPERTDGQDILRHFDGRVSAELRLPEAINRRLLCPFQYFGITDTVDLTSIEWRRGVYSPDQLEKHFLDNNTRTAAILTAVKNKLTNARTACGLGFCVSVAHAHYMANVFNQVMCTP